MKSKEKGNREERKIAKLLSKWMFNDFNVLKRHPTSGTDKSVYIGDVIPMKQINWKRFPFRIECKTGYQNDLPDFWSFNKLRNWFIKVYNEESDIQNIILLICQFHKRQKLLITNCIFDLILPNLSFPVEIGNEIISVNVYNFKGILKISFEELFDINSF